MESIIKTHALTTDNKLSTQPTTGIIAARDFVNLIM